MDGISSTEFHLLAYTTEKIQLMDLEAFELEKWLVVIALDSLGNRSEIKTALFDKS